MLFIICFLLLLTAYVGTGAVYSRGRYANILAQAEQDSYDFKVIESTKKEMRELDKTYSEMRSTNYTQITKHHTSGCDKARYSHIGVCDCGAVKKNRNRHNELSKKIEGRIDEPDVTKPILFWPAYMLGDFVRNGEPSDKELARRMKELSEAEHNVKIAELRAREAAALDKELEALR